MQYFIITSTGQSSNTFSAQEIAGFITAGDVSRDVFVRDENQPEGWLSATSVSEINACHPMPPAWPREPRLTFNYPCKLPRVPGAAIGRLRYFVGLIALNVGLVVLMFGSVVAMIAWGNHFGGSFADTAFLHRAIHLQVNVVKIVALPLSLWLASMRCRDLGMKGWNCLKLLIPLYNMAFFAELISTRGHSSTSR